MATPPKFALYRKLVREGRTKDAARMAAEFEHRGPTPNVVFMDEIADLDPIKDMDDTLDEVATMPLVAGFDPAGHVVVMANPGIHNADWIRNSGLLAGTDEKKRDTAKPLLDSYLATTPPVVAETPVSFTDTGSCDAGGC